jgi:hypothetical protein
MAAGFTPAEFYAMTLLEIGDLMEAWRVTPPVAELVAAFVGYRPPAAAMASIPELPEFEE